MRDLAVETPVEIDERIPRGRTVLALVRGLDGRLGERAAERLVEQPDLLVARSEAVAQLALLRLELRRQRGVLFLELAQAADVGAVRGSHHMGEHVHVAERPAHDRVGRGGMAQRRPIGAGNVAALDRVVPQRAERRFVLRLGELLDRTLVTAVERLLDQLGAALRPRREGDALLVQVVIAGGLGTGDAELDHQPAQLRARQAGADDRAVHAVMHVPDRGAALRDRRDERVGADVDPSRAPSSGSRRARNAGAIAGRPVEKMLDNISGARDVVISVALYLRRYNVVAHYRGLEKGPRRHRRACPGDPDHGGAVVPLIGVAGIKPGHNLTKSSTRSTTAGPSRGRSARAGSVRPRSASIAAPRTSATRSRLPASGRSGRRRFGRH